MCIHAHTLSRSWQLSVRVEIQGMHLLEQHMKKSGIPHYH